MTSTLSRTNSAAISASARCVLRPSDTRSRRCDLRSSRVHAAVAQRRRSIGSLPPPWSSPRTRWSAARRLLRARRERPCRRRAAEQRDEFAPPHDPLLSRPHRSGSNERFDRAEVRLRYCNMKCWPMPQLGQSRRDRLLATLADFRNAPKADAKSGHRHLSRWAKSGCEQSQQAAFIRSPRRRAAGACSGTSRPSALAVLRLITSSNLTGAWTGSSLGFAPLRMRSA